MNKQEMQKRELYWFYWVKKNLGRTVQVIEGDDYFGNYDRVGWRGKLIGYIGLLKDGSAQLAVDFSDYPKIKNCPDIHNVYSAYIELI